MKEDIPKVSPSERDALLENVKTDFEYYQASIIKGDEPIKNNISSEHVGY